MCERLEKWISTLVGVGKKSKVNKESTIMVSSIRRRVLTVALSFCVVLTTIPVAALGGEVVASGTPASVPGGIVSSLETEKLNKVFGADNYSLSGNEIKLEKDIALASTIKFVGVDCVFNLNDKAITAQAGTSTSGVRIGYFSEDDGVSDAATKITINGGPTGTGSITGSASSNAGALEIAARNSGDTITINGGTFTGEKCSGIACAMPYEMINLTINGGKFVGTTWGKYGARFYAGGIDGKITGGYFTSASFGSSDYAEGKYQLSGGTFETIENKGKLSEILATGYTLKKGDVFATDEELAKSELTGSADKPITVVKEPVKDHAHPVCGGNTCEGKHSEHTTGVEYIPLDDGNGNIKAEYLEGNNDNELKKEHYYLTNDVKRSSTATHSPKNVVVKEGADICLNGYNLTFDIEGYYEGFQISNINQSPDAPVNICNCQKTGGIVSNKSAAIFVSDNGAASLYNILVKGTPPDKDDAGSVRNAGGTLNIFGGTITITNDNTYGSDVYNQKTLTMAGDLKLSKGIRLSYDTSGGSRVITLSGKMTNTTPIPINLENCIDGATVIESDGTYTITKEDMAKFTLKNSGYSLQLQGTEKGAKVVVKKQEQTEVPFFVEPSGWAFSGSKVLFCRQSAGTYSDNVIFKLYDAQTGGNELQNIKKIDKTAFYVTDVTGKKEYYVSAQETGKSESKRKKVTVYPKEKTDFSGEVYFNTPKELMDYLNIMKHNSATESESKVSLSQNITVNHDMWFISNFKGILDLGGNTLTHDSGTTGSAITTKAESLTLQNGIIETKSPDGIWSSLGKTVLNKITVKGVLKAVAVEDGNLEVIDSNLMIVASGDSVDPEEFTATLEVGAQESNVIIHDATISNAVTSTGTANYTYLGDKALSEIIATGSTTKQISETITSEAWYQGRQGCKDKIVITKGEAPSTQSKLDQIFGAGNTTFVAPNSININKDIELDVTATITKELLGEADVTINLNGHNITVKPATGAGKDAIVAGTDVNLTIKGPGSIAGGNSTSNGAGGDAVSGSGSVTINGGATITGGNGAGTGTGGNGIDITGSGTVTIDKGTITGGSGATGATGGDGVKTENGNITINDGGSSTGGTGTTTGGNGSQTTGTGNITINNGGSSTGGTGTTGGNGSETDSGNITISGGGTSTGGAGTNGNGTTDGGTGGIGTVTGNTGNTTINGSVTGGNGGNGAANGNGNGGTGGSGVTEDGTIGGSGTITGGNGGNIPEGGSGSRPGTGGAAITGGGSFGGTTTVGQAGLKANAKVEFTNDAPPVTVPETELINGAVTDTERTDTTITHIEVTLTVKKNENPTEKDKVDSAIAKGQEVGVYLDIALAKEISKGSDKTTEQVTNATKPITITVTIPENMRKGSEYKIIRVHNGAAETITPVHDATKHTLTFTTDKFSTYAIAYTPEAGSSGGGTTVIPPVVEDDDHINTPTTGEIEADVTVDDTGKATATVDDKAVSDTIKKAEEEAKINGTLDDGITLVIHVNTKDKGAKYIAFNLSKATQEMILQKKIIKTLIVVDNPKVKITLDLATVKEMNRQANGDILISATLTSGNKLSAAAKKAIGTRPAFDLKATYSGGTITDLGKGKISVEIPYTLRKGETASGLMAVSVDDKGKVSYKTNSSYKAKKMIFNLRSMGIYGVGHKKSTAFTDTKKHWAKEDISFVVSRGLISGTSKTKFSPNTAMNRADLVTALGKITGVKASDYKESSFTDVKDSAAYMPYVEWAVKNEIIKDMGNGKFSPKGKITREELALILQNFAKVMDVELPKVHEKNTFADNSKISPWAKDAVKAMQMAGIIMGEKNNRFDPKGSVTRAQTSATIKRFIELMIDRDTANGWQQNHSGGWMYFEEGKAVKSRTKKISGKKYTFDRYGVTTGYPPVEKPVVRTYKAKRGDSFWSIAKRFKVSMYNLAKINGKTIHSVIRPGDVLKIPNK